MIAGFWERHPGATPARTRGSAPSGVAPEALRRPAPGGPTGAGGGTKRGQRPAAGSRPRRPPVASRGVLLGLVAFFLAFASWPAHADGFPVESGGGKSGGAASAPAAAPATVGANGCAATSEVPETFQVAWVSRLGARAGARTALPVVRVADLRRLVEAEERDPTRVLRKLGLIGKRAIAKGSWKVTIFDVKREWLCRPVQGPEETTIAGVAACPTKLQRRTFAIRAGAWSGCGYLVDASTGDRSLDVFKIEWQAAVAWGFCVLPLRRFLEGA